MCTITSRKDSETNASEVLRSYGSTTTTLSGRDDEARREFHSGSQKLCFWDQSENVQDWTGLENVNIRELFALIQKIIQLGNKWTRHHERMQTLIFQNQHWITRYSTSCSSENMLKNFFGLLICFIHSCNKETLLCTSGALRICLQNNYLIKTKTVGETL